MLKGMQALFGLYTSHMFNFIFYLFHLLMKKKNLCCMKLIKDPFLPLHPFSVVHQYSTAEKAIPMFRAMKKKKKNYEELR